jgi:hypothetical protein
MYAGNAVIERNARRTMVTCNLSCRFYVALRISKPKKWNAVSTLNYRYGFGDDTK